MEKVSFLVVDDAIFMRNVLKKMIEENPNYEVVGEAVDGRDGVKQAQKHQPDVVTLDITMPDMNGVAAAKEILLVSPKTKIIMISAMGQQSMVINAIKNGAHDFVIKPFEKSRVMEAIKNVLLK